MQLHSRMIFLISSMICVLVTQVHAELSVTYEQYKADEVVIKTGRYRMTAQELTKYGLEAIRVTFNNDGSQQEAFICDQSNISLDQAYKKLKCSELKAQCISELSSLIGCIAGVAAFSTVMHKYIAPNPSLVEMGVTGQQSDKSAQFVEENTGLALLLIATFVGYFFIGMPTLYIYPSAVAYYFNDALHTILCRELLTDVVLVPAGQTVTKLMLVNMEKKDATA